MTPSRPLKGVEDTSEHLRHGSKYLVGVDASGKRHLNHDAIDVRALVQGLHLGQYLATNTV